MFHDTVEIERDCVFDHIHDTLVDLAVIAKEHDTAILSPTRPSVSFALNSETLKSSLEI